MSIDINLIRTEKGEDPAKVIESEKKRFKDLKIVDELIKLDKEWRTEKYKLDSLRRDYNTINTQIADKKKASKGKDLCEEEIKQIKEVEKNINTQSVVESNLLNEVNKLLRRIGNIVHESVPVSKDEKDNQVVRTWGKPKEEWKIDSTLGNLHHNEVLQLLDGYDSERGARIAGHRGFFLKNTGVLLNQAIINYGINFLVQRGYTVMQTPYFMKKSVMSETAQLADFDEQLYRVEGEKDSETMYLIATSEQPISAYHYTEWLKESDLPFKYGGYSSCFRKEAGAHGKDLWGIFRVHQFEKIEQFCLTTPEKSWEMHEEMIKTSEEFYQSLELPYRVVNIVSGELNDAAAKKYDLEAWFPGYEAYRELVSCSNCTDYQSRGLDIRCGIKKSEEKRYVHMLNATLCATERCMCCILENYQTKEGLRIPKVLVPYMNGVEFIPYKPNLVEGFLEESKEGDSKDKQKGKKGNKKEGKKGGKKEAKDKKAKELKEPEQKTKEAALNEDKSREG
jgi:seryl-tRNA synthetase